MLLIALGLVGVAAVGVGIDAVTRVVRPESVEPSSADAVVILAGGSGERVARALELMEAGVAPTLVVSLGTARAESASHQRLAALCEEVDYETVCLVPDPETTRGEAGAVGRVAAERGWRSLAIVTSEYHLDRARFHVERCFDGTVHPVAAAADPDWEMVRHELVGYLHARTIGRSCPR